MAVYVAAVTPLAFAPTNAIETGGLTRVAASPESVARFEQLLYAQPISAGATTSASVVPSSGVSSPGLGHYFEKLSQRWDAGQLTLQRMTEHGEFTTRDLVTAQMQMVNCALDMELSSRCAGMFENGVQTLIQRSG
jgi:hypothetical protein